MFLYAYVSHIDKTGPRVVVKSAFTTIDTRKCEIIVVLPCLLFMSLSIFFFFFVVYIASPTNPTYTHRLHLLRSCIQQADASSEGDQALQSMDASAPGIHASLMVALEHPSGTVRARAVEQLSKAVSEAAGAVGSRSGQGDDLTAAVLRRLYDEDPEVVLAVTGSDILLERVLLRPTSTSPAGDQNSTEVVEESAGGGGSVSSRAAAVSSAAFIAATPWLSALSQARPSHPVPSVGRVLCGLLRVASAAVTAIGERVGGSISVELEEEEKTREAAARLMLECLPGPHANARVRLARRACAAFRDTGGGSSGKADDAADAAIGRACKKAVRAVGRAAVEAVCGLGDSPEGSCLGVFDGVGEALSNKAGVVQGNVSSSSKKKRKGGSKGNEGDAMDVDGGKSKGLKEMGEELCDALAAGFSAGDKTEQIQVREW